MPIDVEVNLKIPRVKAPVLDEKGYPIDNSMVRFTKLIQVPALPKPGAPIDLTIRSGQTLACEVTRADWHDERELFVLSCKYAKRSMPADECAALFSDAEWHMKPLL